MSSSGGFKLMDDDNESGGPPNLTANQKSVLNSRGGDDMWSSFSNGGGGGGFSDDWKKPMGVVSLFAFLGFLLGCIATDMARTNADDIADLQHKHSSQHTDCEYGDILFGEELHVSDSGNGGAYQIVGDHDAAITWKQAYDDARGRCYNGKPGYLAIIGNEWENAFIQNLIQNFPTYQQYDDAWIGATDTGAEGTFEWIGPRKMAEGIVFYEDGEAVNDAYINWAAGEPNSGGHSATDEDCIAMYGGGGKWYDKNCYGTLPFFVVEFGPPNIDDDAWDAQHDDALADDAFEAKK